MKKLKRSQLFVDREVQAAFFTRTFIYWAVWLVVSLLVVCGIHFANSLAHLNSKSQQPDELWTYLRPILLASVALLPIVLYDVVMLSNRLAGSLMRLRGAMRRLAAGEHVEPIKFREGDFWIGFAEEFNAVVARLEHLERELERASLRSFAEEEALAGESA